MVDNTDEVMLKEKATQQLREVDAGGIYLPWLATGAAGYLMDKILPTFKVMEVGSGRSSIWFAQRCQYIVSFESSKVWADVVQQEAHRLGLFNLKVHYIDNPNQPWEDVYKDYVHDLSMRFDLLFVDGNAFGPRHRVVLRMHYQVSPGGLVVIDDFDRVNIRDRCVQILGDPSTIFRGKSGNGRSETAVWIK